MIHAGDLVNLRAGNHDTEWGGWFGAGAWLHAMVPSIVAAGNHEYVKSDTADIYSGLSPHWNPVHAAAPTDRQGWRERCTTWTTRASASSS
jgi:acid phosphatase type 7